MDFKWCNVHNICCYYFATASKNGKRDYTVDELENRLRARKELPELEVEKRAFNTSNGFIAGMYSQLFVLVILWLPNLILFNIDISGWAEWLRSIVFAYDLILRFWFVMYSQFFVTFPELFPWLCVIYSGIFVVICGIGYRSGPNDRRKEQIIIERNKQKKENSTHEGVIDR